FYPLMLLTAAVGGTLVALAAGLEGNTNVGTVLLRDVGIATIVAAFLAVTIELYSGTRLEKRVAENVLDATFEKLVPPVIYAQVRDNVFRSEVMRHDWTIELSIFNRETHA